MLGSVSLLFCFVSFNGCIIRVQRQNTKANKTAQEMSINHLQHLLSVHHLKSLLRWFCFVCFFVGWLVPTAFVFLLWPQKWKHLLSHIAGMQSVVIRVLISWCQSTGSHRYYPTEWQGWRRAFLPTQTEWTAALSWTMDGCGRDWTCKP